MTNLPMQFQQLRLPAIASPLFIISNPDLVIEQCKAGIVGSFPALNAREADGEPIELERWLTRITEELDAYNQANPDTPAAPFAVNQIVHKSNARLERDMEICVKHKVPVWITSLGARPEVFEAARSCGGVALHDVTTNTHARKAIAKGADGLIAVAAGAGGHAGTISPFALIQEIREWFDGTLVLGGSLATGRALLAAQVMGADLGYMGSAFIATHEANAASGYKDMIVSDGAEDILYSNLFTGVHGNYLKNSVIASGLDPNNLESSDPSKMSFASNDAKAWKNIWGSGQGIGAVRSRMSAAEFIQKLAAEYAEARTKIAAAG